MVKVVAILHLTFSPEERERRQVTHAAVREEPHRACELKLHEIKAALVTQQVFDRWQS